MSHQLPQKSEVNLYTDKTTITKTGKDKSAMGNRFDRHLKVSKL